MGDMILQLDYDLFNLVNNHWNNVVLDFILPFLRNKYFWAPFYVFLVFFLVINFKKKGWYLIIALLVMIFISDQLASSVIKPLVHRLRPCNDYNLLNNIRVLVGCSNSFSFPSAHATNHFAIALFLSTCFSVHRWVKPVLLLWAGAISYSQVYVGLHFPADVIAGGILGGFIGYWSARYTVKWFNIKMLTGKEKQDFPGNQ